MTAQQQRELNNVLERMRLMEYERAPSLILDKCDVKLLMDYILSLKPQQP